VTPEVNDSNDQWEDEALATATARKAAVATGSTAELLELKALDLKANEKDDIAEKLRIEETKKQLAAAKEGMEKEAQRIKEQREMKFTDVATSKPRFSGAAAPRFGAAAAGLAATGGKWVPPHMRGGGGMVPRGLGVGRGSHKLDTQDESLFPDLAAADAILEQQKEKPAYSVAKKTPVGGGATWGSKPKIKKAKPEKSKEEQTPEPAEEEASAPAPAPEPVEASVPKSTVKPKKKKKKDLSTFKPAS
jgi:hypothetical protein